MGVSLFLAACHDYVLYLSSFFCYVLLGKIKFLLLLLTEYYHIAYSYIHCTSTNYSNLLIYGHIK